MEMALLVGSMASAGTALMGANAPAPPPVATPAIPAPTSRKDPAEVRIGDGIDPNNPTGDVAYSDFTEKRVSAKSLGGLGRSGLGL